MRNHPPVRDILYRAKFSWVFNFADFINFQSFAKIFKRKVWTHGAQRVCAANSRNYFNEIFKNRYSGNLDPRKFSDITSQNLLRQELKNIILMIKIKHISSYLCQYDVNNNMILSVPI